ncbi:MAG: hypothetical protein VX690_04110 [Pseudomonadota bacterium]|nr:hypothetical protein [Pseudomonadota bacterium]
MDKVSIRPIDLNSLWQLIVRPSTLISLSMILLFPGLCVGQTWTRYINQTDLFTVNFPGEPIVEEVDFLSEYGVIFPARTYTANTPPSRHSVTVVNFTETERLHKERSAQTGIEVYAQEWISDVLGSIAYTAWNIRQRSHEITYDAFHTVDRIAGHLLQITNTDESRTFVGLYLHASRLYILEATVPKGWPPPGHFQQSLGIYDEEGNRVRYNLDVDGNRTRDYSQQPYIDTLPD